MKRFCVLTSGRAGSTALMDALSQFDDIGVPHKQIDCVDNEILHPQFITGYMQQYEQLSGLPVHDELSLIHAFYESNRQSSYAGFKSMPERHRHLDQLAGQENLQIITLTRMDTASTIASFLAAFDAGTWRRTGGTQEYCLTFGPTYEKRAIGHLRYIERCERSLRCLNGAIHLKYEELCERDYVSPPLNNFFDRPIRLNNPVPPTSASTYVTNWSEFCEFLQQHRQHEKML